MNTDLTLRQIADFFGVSLSAAQRLATEGLLIRSSRGRFDLQASARRYTAHLREIAANRSSSDAARAGIRAKTATARLTELRARQLDHELVEYEAVKQLLQKLARLWKAGFLSLPPRIRQGLRLSVQQEQQLENLIDDRLEELAEEIEGLNRDAPLSQPRLRLNVKTGNLKPGPVPHRNGGDDGRED